MKTNHLVRPAITLLVAVFATVTAWAADVSEAEALQKAQAFLAGRGGLSVQQQPLRIAMKGRRAQRKTVAASDYYVFNVSNDRGFVIVSGDDRTVAILGYADSGSISEDNMPDALRCLLEDYSEQLRMLDETDGDTPSLAENAARRASSVVRTPISPLISTRWNQGNPYNNFSPTIPSDGSEKAVTGCVATTMAQLMYYHRYPTEACTAIPGYSFTTKDAKKEACNLTLDALPSITFDWSSMLSAYGSSATEAQKTAVARLMQYCGWSLKMTYGLSGNGGSSSYNENIPYALKTYFGYDSGVRHTYRQNYSYEEWVGLLYDELAAGRPIALGGQSVGGGHSFICDGYDTDDYFHMNWGWGGSDDGYFRLSLLNPYEQGIGGSSTLDGFGFSQVAVIGIQPPVSGTCNYCLSLEGLWLGGADAALTSKTFTRDEYGSFSGISIYYRLFSYNLGANNTFDYALQLVDGSGQVVQTFDEQTNQTMNFNKVMERTVTGITIPNTVADGTYIIKVVGRPTGGSDWMECFDGDRYQLSATITGDQLTVTVPITATLYPIAAVFTVSGNKTVGYEQEVTVSLTGGTAPYHGNVVFCVDEKAVMGKMLDIPAGQTVDARFSYVPSVAGKNVLKLYTNRDDKGNGSGTRIGTSSTVTIAESDATNTLTLTKDNISYVIENLDKTTGKLYGNALRVKVTVTNPSSDHTFASKFSCLLREYASAGTDDFVSIAKQKHIVIEKGSSTDVSFDYDGLTLGKFYRLRFSYVQGYEEDGEQKTRTVPFDPTDLYEMVAGYSLYAADGSVTIRKLSGTIDAAGAACVDLTAVSSFDDVTVTISSNPNCLYLLASGVTLPGSLSGKNVVVNGSAAQLTLTDGYDFFTPVSFTAATAAYTRTFTLAANGTSGWNTLFLPFSVSAITVPNGPDTEKPIDWFHSTEDTGKHFWLRQFAGDGEGTVTFDFATAMTANTPYIIAVPDDRWGSEWQLTEKAITFRGTNVSVAATATASSSGSHYKLCGSTVAGSLTVGYLLNDEGSDFVKIMAPATIGAFRAYFLPVSISSLSLPALSIGSPETAGISMPPLARNAAVTPSQFFTLDGRRLSAKPVKKGLYIINGKKIVIR